MNQAVQPTPAAIDLCRDAPPRAAQVAPRDDRRQPRDELADRRGRHQQPRLRRRLLGLRLGARLRHGHEPRAGRSQGARQRAHDGPLRRTRPAFDLPGGSYRGEHAFAGRRCAEPEGMRRAPRRAACLVREALPGPQVDAVHAAGRAPQQVALDQPGQRGAEQHPARRLLHHVDRRGRRRRAGRDARPRSPARAASPTSTCRSKRSRRCSIACTNSCRTSAMRSPRAAACTPS